jgi:hypothetical protein
MSAAEEAVRTTISIEICLLISVEKTENAAEASGDKPSPAAPASGFQTTPNAQRALEW